MHVDRSYLNILAPAFAVLHTHEAGQRITRTGDSLNRERRQQGQRGESREAEDQPRSEAQTQDPAPSQHTLDITV